MRRADFKRPPRSPEERGFREFLSRLIHVPKSQIDEREEVWKARPRPATAKRRPPPGT